MVPFLHPNEIFVCDCTVVFDGLVLQYRFGNLFRLVWHYRFDLLGLSLRCLFLLGRHLVHSCCG